MEISRSIIDLNQAEQETTCYLIKAINNYRRNHNITQTKLANRLSLSQGTISKKLKEKYHKDDSGTMKPLSFAEAYQYCQAMGSSIGKVLFEYEQQFSQNSLEYDKLPHKEYFSTQISENIPKEYDDRLENKNAVLPSYVFSEGENLVNDINDPLFTPWFGKYHCYFYSTLSTEDICFHGLLDIPEDSPNGLCWVNFDFTYDEQENLHKNYYGQLILSRKTNGAYCTLINHSDQGEITFLVMSNPEIKNRCVCCVVAFAATISGGKDTKHPCIERMIISREPLTGKNFELSKAHLLLNDKYIRITEKSFCALMQNDNLPTAFKNRFDKLENPFDAPLLSEYLQRIAVIPESWVKSLPDITEQEQQIIIDFMRLYSLAQKNNKIKQKTAENDIFNLYKKDFKKWTLSFSDREHRTD